jgi:3',5'-cyclic AMP phosphodiesterase CpdA
VLDLTTVADDEAVAFDGGVPRRYEGLEPGTEYEIDGVTFRTLPRPGEPLCRFAAVNDVHFGETECGLMEGVDLGPVFQSAEGDDPYPEVMNRGAIAEMQAIAPEAVLVKGDMTAHGTEAEYRRFLAAYEPAFGDRLHVVRGNHDVCRGESFAGTAPFAVELPGAVLAMIDTSVPFEASGGLAADTLEWLDELAGRAGDDRPILVFGHHQPWSPQNPKRSPDYFGINPDDSIALVDLVARRSRVAGYFAGHTHRNRVRRFPQTGDVPWVEVACVKDFPGTWVEYRVFDRGVLHIARRISTAEALDWSERTRGMFGGLYAGYAFGSIDDRCFPIHPRPLEPLT